MKTKLPDYLSAPLPTTYRNWRGEPERVRYPTKGRLVASCGSVFLFIWKGEFTLVYGLQVTSPADRDEAASEFGQACLHQAQCEGLL